MIEYSSLDSSYWYKIRVELVFQITDMHFVIERLNPSLFTRTAHFEAYIAIYEKITFQITLSSI